MKKNLISAVAAGLALALAITSFGCESGNDNPVHYAYTRGRYAYADDAAAEAGDVFTYVAKPNSYTAVRSNTTMPATYYDKDTRNYNTIKGTYTWVSVVDGKNSYNVIFSDTKKDDVDGTNVGDVLSTMEKQIALNAAEKTYVVSEFATVTKVYKLVDNDYTSTSHEDNNYLSTYEMGWDVDAGSSSTVLVPAAGAYDVVDHRYHGVGGSEPADYASGEDDSIDDVKRALHEVIVDQLEVIEEIKNDPLSLDEDLAEALKDLSYFQANLAFAEGATVWISKQSSLSGVLTKEDTFLTKVGGAVVSTYLEVAGDYEPITGTYKVASGNYKDGTILLTSIEEDGVEIVFDDEKGKYYLDGMGPYDLDAQFYEADEARTLGGGQGRYATYTKKGRTLNIAGGVLTSTAVFDSYSTGSSIVVKTNDFFLGKSYDTYKAAYEEALDDTSHTVRETSYKFVLDDN